MAPSIYKVAHSQEEAVSNANYCPIFKQAGES